MLLDDYVDSLGAARGTLHFYNPAAISGDGKTIISSAYNPSTNTGGTYMIRPEVGVISGTVDLSNLSVSPVGQVITVIVRQGGTDIPVSATLAADGTYSVETGISGAVDILIKGSHWLRASAGNFTLGYTGVTANATLINGDCNPDNEINLADYSALSAAFGSVSGDSNWNPQADLDGDGEVTLADYGILSANFGQAGDE